jgi:hypothetical protein
MLPSPNAFGVPSSAPRSPSSSSIVSLAVVNNVHQLGHRRDSRTPTRSSSASAASPTVSLLSGERLSLATSPPRRPVMPVISTGKVLVSGANGFIATVSVSCSPAPQNKRLLRPAISGSCARCLSRDSPSVVQFAQWKSVGTSATPSPLTERNLS